MPQRLREFWLFLQNELAEEQPGRVARTVQLGSLCLVVVLLSMTLRVPFIAISLIVLFYGIQSNSTFTKLATALFLAVAVAEIGIVIPMIKYTYDYPLLRIGAASVLLFVSVYLMRACKLGIMFFSVAIAVSYSQTIPDSVDFPELAMRGLLWSIAAALYPVALMFFVCGYLFPSRPFGQLQRALTRQLGDVSACLERLVAAEPTTGVAAVASEARIEKDALMLLPLDGFAGMDDPGYRAIRPYWRACVAVVAHLRNAANTLAIQGGALTEAGRAVLGHVRAEVDALSTSVSGGRRYRRCWTPTDAERTTANEHGLGGIVRALEDLARVDVKQTMPEAAKGGLMVPDALTNPAYPRFALKVTLAMLFCYVLYHGMQWDGIHTSMLTCVIVANPSNGASFQKMILRFCGALIGVVLALFATIVVVPQLDSIGGFLLLLAPIFFAGAWVAAGSERSAYIGTQFVFTFSLALLEDGFGPVNDLTEIRDRAIGILIGLAVATVTCTLIWPESEAQTLRRTLSDALDEIKKLVLTAQGEPGDSRQADHYQQRLACWKAFELADGICNRVSMEFDLQSDERASSVERARGVLAQCRLIVEDWCTLRDGLIALDRDWARHPGLKAWRGQIANALDRYARSLSGEPSGTAAQGPLALPSPTGFPSPLAEQERQLAHHILNLPDWTTPDLCVGGTSVQKKQSS